VALYGIVESTCEGFGQWEQGISALLPPVSALATVMSLDMDAARWTSQSNVPYIGGNPMLTQ
jgi:hypothetical protein